MSDMALKLPRHFYLLMENSLCRYFQVRSRYCQIAQCNRKPPVSSRWHIMSQKVKKRIVVINHSYSVSINTLGKDEVDQCKKASTSQGIFIVTPSLERWPTSCTFSPIGEVKLRLIFLSFRDDLFYFFIYCLIVGKRGGREGVE